MPGHGHDSEVLPETSGSILAELIAVKHGKIRGRAAAELSMQWNKLREHAKPGQGAGV